MDEVRRGRWRRKGWLAAGLAVAFVALGYLSNAVTSAACEQATSRWLTAQLVATPPAVPGPNAWNKRAVCRLPWLASVEYGLAVGNLGGEQGRRYYLCLFGHPLPLWDEVEIQA